MFSRTAEVIRQKNKSEHDRKVRRKNELAKLKATSAFRARFHEELKKLEIILQDSNVESVVIDVPEKFMSQFESIIYSEDLVGYSVIQKDNENNKFYIRRKFIAL
jgi:hypothetical protein